MRRIVLAFLLALPASALLCGCNRGADPKGPGTGKGADQKWSGSGKSDMVNKDGAFYPRNFQDLTFDDRVYFVIVGTAGAGAGAATEADYVNGKSKGALVFQPDNRRIAWSCTTSDGATGAVVIDGQNFDLAKGAVFLVTLKDKKTTVDQVAVDIAKLQGGAIDQKLQAVAETEPRIAAFLKASRGEK